MKKTNYVIAICLSTYCKCQISAADITSTRFPIKPTSEWLVFYEEMDFGTSHAEGDEITRFFVNGDTSINDKTYFKLYKSGTSFYDVPFYFNNIYVGAIRDQDNKFYYLEKGNSSEILLYDFNLSVGDTIHSSIDEGMEVSGIETLADGRRKINYRKTDFQLGKCSYWANSFFVEGIGSMGGLFFVSPCFHVGYKEHFLSCYSEDGKIIYNSTLSTRRCMESSSRYPINPKGKWNIIIMNGYDYDKTDEKYTYYIEGDTTISSTRYYKLYKTGVAYYDEPFYYSHLYIGAIRDSENKFYFVSKDQSSVILLCDFNLEMNDTIKGEISKGQIINSTGTLPDGRKKIASIPEACAGCCPTPVFLEGIGNASGLVEEATCNHPGFQRVYLSCYFEGESLIYENPDYSAKFCDYKVSLHPHPVVSNMLNIYPVPSNNFITVQGNYPELSIQRIEIYNISGSVVYINSAAEKCNKVDIGRLNSGVYLLRAISNNYSFIGKFIKE